MTGTCYVNESMVTMWAVQYKPHYEHCLKDGLNSYVEMSQFKPDLIFKELFCGVDRILMPLYLWKDITGILWNIGIIGIWNYRGRLPRQGINIAVLWNVM
jgi:hypothetical protein